MLERTVRLPFPIDVRRTLAPLRHGRYDPTCRFARDGIWRASRGPGGPVTVRLIPDGDRVHASAWGEGADAALDSVPALVGCHDDDGGFAPTHPVVSRLWHDLAAIRVPRSGAVAETLVNVVIEQRVTTFEARRAQSQLVRRWSDDAPGPAPLRLPIDPEVLAGIPYYDLHVLGIERKRADTIRRVAAMARLLDQITALPLAEARARLQAVAGVGPWSAAEAAFRALGDADAVPIGDVHLPSTVTYALTGVAIDDDEAMLAALAPFAGNRGRVIRLIGAGSVRAPRRAPRYAPRDIRTQ